MLLTCTCRSMQIWLKKRENPFRFSFFRVHLTKALGNPQLQAWKWHLEMVELTAARQEGKSQAQSPKLCSVGLENPWKSPQYEVPAWLRVPTNPHSQWSPDCQVTAEAIGDILTPWGHSSMLMIDLLYLRRGWNHRTCCQKGNKSLIILILIVQ